MNVPLKTILRRTANLYIDGFRDMTWGKVLWVLIALKLLILFGILRIFFFVPDMADKTEEQKMEIVGKRLSSPKRQLTTTHTNNNNTDYGSIDID